MPLHIGKIIRQRLEETGMNKSEFARRINTTPQNIYGIFKRKSIDTDLLKEISQVLEYDFFQYYSHVTFEVNDDGEPYYSRDKKYQHKTVVELMAELQATQRELELLRKENAYLKEINSLLRERTMKE